MTDHNYKASLPYDEGVDISLQKSLLALFATLENSDEDPVDKVARFLTELDAAGFAIMPK